MQTRKAPTQGFAKLTSALLRQALAWVRDGYTRRLYIIAVNETELRALGYIDSHGEITPKGRAMLDNP